MYILHTAVPCIVLDNSCTNPTKWLPFSHLCRGKNLKLEEGGDLPNVTELVNAQIFWPWISHPLHHLIHDWEGYYKVSIRVTSIIIIFQTEIIKQVQNTIPFLQQITVWTTEEYVRELLQTSHNYVLSYPLFEGCQQYHTPKNNQCKSEGSGAGSEKVS